MNDYTLENVGEYAVTFKTTTEITLKIRANSEEEAKERAEEIPYYEAGKHPSDIVIGGDQYGTISNIEKLK